MSYAEPRPPGAALLVFGVVLPLVALVVELATGLCAGAFFDPIPTWGHALAVLAVPSINYALWRAARRDRPGPPWLMAAAGAASVVAFAYAVVFLPLLPIALVGIIFLGLGLLPFSPALALVSSIKLAGRLVGDDGRDLRRWLGGVAAGLAALVLVDLPAAATYLAVGWAGGDEASVRKGTALMRAAGDESMLLRLCYGEGGRATGLASFAISSWAEGIFAGQVSTSSTARELYYRTTGRPFNAVERPRRGGEGAWLFGFDEDRGGTTVGGRADGLELTASRLDGSVAASDNLAYLEWTALLANRSESQQEARLTLALPPGAVASRATLWVNGEPREASIAGRGEARAAYEAVVNARRDPLLVTTDGAGRLRVQAFPVPPGRSLKLRIGLTVPLDIAADGARGFALPAIAERNFELAADLRHQLWIEGGGRLGASLPGVGAQTLPSGDSRIRVAIGDGDLARRPRILAGPILVPVKRTAVVPAASGQPALNVVQTIARVRAPPPFRLILLVDGSAANRRAAAGLGKALGALPVGLPVGLFVAADTPRMVEPAPWSPDQKSRMLQALADTAFGGGQDNLPALADALQASAGRDSVLVWIHGPQPVAFARSGARLDQLLERSRELPRLVRYQAETGPMFAVAGHPWFETAREAPATGDAGADLMALLRQLSGGGETWQATRALAAGPAGPASSVHIARLWGAGRLATAATAKGREREQAIALAHRLNIVTPVSGAVVLETDSDYKRSGLAVPNSGDVPTVPEPSTWALIAIVAALLLWQLRRRRRWALA